MRRLLCVCLEGSECPSSTKTHPRAPHRVHSPGSADTQPLAGARGQARAAQGRGCGGLHWRGRRAGRRRARQQRECRVQRLPGGPRVVLRACFGRKGNCEGYLAARAALRSRRPSAGFQRLFLGQGAPQHPSRGGARRRMHRRATAGQSRLASLSATTSWAMRSQPGRRAAVRVVGGQRLHMICDGRRAHSRLVHLQQESFW